MSGKRFMYPFAGGRHTPPGTRRFLQRFREMPLRIRKRLVPLFPAVLGSSTAEWKPAPFELNYVDISPIEGQICQNCVHGVIQMMTNTPFCAAMQETIDPAGWCDRWSQVFDYPWDLVDEINRSLK